MLSVLVCTKMICCMALNISLINPRFLAFSQLIWCLSIYWLNGAGNGNRTRLSCLEGRRTSRCTTPAEMADQRGGVSPPEKIGTLKKGEKIFSLFPVSILYKNFSEKSTYFLRNHRQYSWYASSRLGYGKPQPFLHLCQLLTRLSQYCSKDVPTVS